MRAMKTNTLSAAPAGCHDRCGFAAGQRRTGGCSRHRGHVVLLDAAAAHITQPDGSTVYSWGYGCQTAPAALPSGRLSPSFREPIVSRCSFRARR